MKKEIFFELNKDINGWNIGTKMDVYFDFYIYLIKQHDGQDEFTITNKKLEKFYNEYKKGQVKDFETIMRQFKPQFEILNLANFSKTKVSIVNIFQHDRIDENTLIDFFANKIETINCDELFSVKERQWLYSVTLLLAFKMNILDLEDILLIKGIKKNLSKAFIKLYFLKHENTKCNSKYVKKLNSEHLQTIIKNLAYEEIDPSIIFTTRINKNAREKTINKKVDEQFSVNIEPKFLNRDAIEQAKFRKALESEAKFHEKEYCWLCGKYNINFCEAAHIIPHSKSGTFNVNNGLLLCPSCHKAYDSFIIGITPNGNVISNNSRMQKHDNFDTSGLKLNEIFLNKERRVLLKETYEKFNSTL